MKKDILEKGQYWIIPNDGIPPVLHKNKEWYKIRMSLAIIGKDNFKNKLLEKVPNGISPEFILVATDKEVAKIAIGEMIDNLFSAFDNK